MNYEIAIDPNIFAKHPHNKNPEFFKAVHTCAGFIKEFRQLHFGRRRKLGGNYFMTEEKQLIKYIPLTGDSIYHNRTSFFYGKKQNLKEFQTRHSDEYNGVFSDEEGAFLILHPTVLYPDGGIPETGIELSFNTLMGYKGTLED